MIAVKVNHPYENHAYDQLSRGDDPKVGRLSPEVSQREVKEHVKKALPHFDMEGKKIAGRAQQVLLFTADRIDVDVFLRSTLSQVGELDSLVALADQKPETPLLSVDWTAGLEFSLEPPVAEKIQMMNVELSELKTYSDPRGDLVAVEFDW